MTKDKVLLVADYFLKKAAEEKKPLSPLKIQKLLYYAQAWNLVLNKKPLFPDNFQAWVHGPAIPKVWHEFRDFDFQSPPASILKEDFSGLSAEERSVIDQVWNIYGKYPANYLEALTHAELPWQEARGELDGGEASQNVISTDTMTTYYGEKLQAAQQRAG